MILAIPCYNCEPQIERVFEELDQDLISEFSEILVIDNQSLDGTRAVAARLVSDLNARCGQQKSRLICNEKNLGLGGTHKVAFRLGKAQGADYVAILHGDNQAVSGELNQLVDEIKRNPELSAALGARFHWRSKRYGYSLVRIVGNFALNILYSVFSGRCIYDLGSGINIFKVSDLKEVDYARLDNGFAFNMDLLLCYLSQRRKFAYVPITWREVDQTSNASAIRVGWQALTILLRWRFKRQRR